MYLFFDEFQYLDDPGIFLKVLYDTLKDRVKLMVNKNEIANTLGIDFRTLSKYMEILQYTFVFSFVPPFFKNTRKEISKMPKVYSNEKETLKREEDKIYIPVLLLPFLDFSSPGKGSINQESKLA